MPKSFFTQGTTVLLERACDMAALKRALKEFAVERELEPSAEAPWMGGEGLVVAMRPEVNGHLLVDVIDHAWPDAMGDPQTDPTLFAAWSMGWFGPFTYPGALQRAQVMSFSWPEAADVTNRHRAFVRVKASYAVGAAPDDPVLPEDYDPLAELERVTEVTSALLSLPGALAYFNPNGEVLRSRDALRGDLAEYRNAGLVPLPIWSNVRLFRFEPDWLMMDTVGMEQLDVDDHEACFRKGVYEPGDADNFLRNATDYVRENGPVIKDGDTMDGPGEIRWQARHLEESLAERPRSVLRWFPMDGSTPPDRLVP
jgi:hypothetical protein